jgi:hypothetical protein
MAEPIEDDCAHALIVMVYQARELLSLAEREADVNDHPNAATGGLHLETALRHLNGALAMAMELPTQTRQTRAYLDRAIRATEATSGHVKLYGLYAAIESPTTVEAKQVGQLRNIWRRAARSAKQEAHRALHDLTERFPDAYDIEEP